MEHIEGKNFDIHILTGEEVTEFLGKLAGSANPVDALGKLLREEQQKDGDERDRPPGKFAIGDRVRTVPDEDVKDEFFGHVDEICDCPWATLLGTRCISLALHESCGGGRYHAKEYRLEHLD